MTYVARQINCCCSPSHMHTVISQHAVISLLVGRWHSVVDNGVEGVGICDNDGGGGGTSGAVFLFLSLSLVLGMESLVMVSVTVYQ